MVIRRPSIYLAPASATFETTRRGYEQLVAWADHYTVAPARARAVEGASSLRSRGVLPPVGCG